MKDEILELLKNEYDALTLEDIAKLLNYSEKEDIDKLEYNLNKLVRDNVVRKTNKNKYILFEHCTNFITGIISVNSKGFGFIDFDDQPSIHIDSNSLKYALDGDEVIVEIIGKNTKNQKREGKVISITKRNTKNVVGVIRNSGKKLYFEPTEIKNIFINIEQEYINQCVEGEIVVATITDNVKNNVFNAVISHHIGHKDDAGMDILEIAAKYDIYTDVDPEAMQQAEDTPNEVREEDFIGRTDLRDKMIFTIDGADTKDIDDAISLDVDGQYYKLGVHIADVSYYVTEGSPLDLEAQKRGTSSYLAYSVIPMLPHKLSNGICSLNEGVDRCAMSCMMTIDKKGNIVDSHIFPSIIRSNKKMTYKSVNHILEDNIIDEGYEDFADKLKSIQEVAHILRNKRTLKGASDFDIEEPKLICDEDGRCIDIKANERGEGERLIEDLMIAANETVAKTLLNPSAALDYMYTTELPGVYRVHAAPNVEKVQDFIKFCNSTGHTIKGKFNNSDITPAMYKKILDQLVFNGKEAKIYRSLAVRTMTRAFYDSYNIGHFGLASEAYTHFTSPIRRYPDLIAHRLLRTFLFKKKLDSQTTNYYNNILPSLTKLCSDREQKAVEAEREVDKMKMAEYMEMHIGEEFDGVVSGVTNFGMFVQLDNLVEGMIPIQSLEGDYFELVPELQSLIGKSTKKTFTVGQDITIKVVSASKELQKIDFEIAKKDNDNE